MTVAARHSDGFFDRGAQVTRLESFVDAAFAFALTAAQLATGLRAGASELAYALPALGAQRPLECDAPPRFGFSLPGRAGENGWNDCCRLQSRRAWLASFGAMAGFA
jgi:hypothetical protein